MVSFRAGTLVQQWFDIFTITIWNNIVKGAEKSFTGYSKTREGLTIYLKKCIIISMKEMMKRIMAETMKRFSLPRYEQLPDMGLYLEQTVKYVNQLFAPLECVEITGSMVRNYVKMGLIENPVKKQYYRQHIAYIIAVTLLKQVVPLEQIMVLFRRQKKVYSVEVAYDYFCMELENVMGYRFGLKAAIEDIGKTSSIEKEMLRSAITAVSHTIFLNACMSRLAGEEAAAAEGEQTE